MNPQRMLETAVSVLSQLPTRLEVLPPLMNSSIAPGCRTSIGS